MKRLAVLFCLIFTMVMGAYAQAEKMDEEMVNAQLRFIKEKAELSRKEYQKFAKIYLDYNKALFELNSKRAKENSGNNDNPFGFGFIPDPGKADKYMKEWREINDSYMEKLEKQLSEDARRRIGEAQFELGQKMWQQMNEKMRKDAEERMKEYGKHMEEMGRQFEERMKQAGEQQQGWWENYWKERGGQPHFPTPGFGPGHGPGQVPGQGFNPGPRFHPGFNPEQTPSNK